MNRVTLTLSLFAAAAFAQEPQAKKPEVPKDTVVKTTASGLKYCVLTEGEKGAHPRLGDTVRVHYTGWLTDGKIFDSSVQRGEPAEFALGRVIEGWNEGLQLMTKGARFKLTIPPELAYGDEGAGNDIPGKATLIFEVELLDLVPGPQLPGFHEGNADRQKKTESGIVWETLTEGSGEAVTKDDPLELKIAFWNERKELIDCSEMSMPLFAMVARIRLKFMADVVPGMKKGQRIRCEVPPALCFAEQAIGTKLPPNSKTIWELEVIRKVEQPKFVASDDSKLKKTASGLAYEILREGSGRNPKETDTVSVHYTGWLTDGTVFDSSHTRLQPASFPLKGVIKGWTEGLQLMQPGAIFQFTIPAELAYGAQQKGKIPANSTLIFYVELLKIGQ